MGLGMQTTPERLFESLIDNDDYSAALRLAQAFHISSDTVYKRQWTKAVVAVGGRVTPQATQGQPARPPDVRVVIGPRLIGAVLRAAGARRGQGLGHCAVH